VGGKGGGGAGGEMTQALYAHMNNKIIKKEKKLKYRMINHNSGKNLSMRSPM
jgi:hypothetical protein